MTDTLMHVHHLTLAATQPEDGFAADPAVAPAFGIPAWARWLTADTDGTAWAWSSRPQFDEAAHRGLGAWVAGPARPAAGVPACARLCPAWWTGLRGAIPAHVARHLIAPVNQRIAEVGDA